MHDAAVASTPSRLSQHYMIVDVRFRLCSRPIPVQLLGLTAFLQLPKKLDVLWSFIKSHLKSKCVVFLSSCKQVQDHKNETVY